MNKILMILLVQVALLALVGCRKEESVDLGDVQSEYFVVNGVKVAGTYVSETPGVFCTNANDYGRYFGSSSLFLPVAGYYWSSTEYNASLAYNLTFHSSYVYTQYNNFKTNQFSVRCVQ